MTSDGFDPSTGDAADLMDRAFVLYVERGGEVTGVLDSMAKAASPAILDNSHGGFADRPMPSAEDVMTMPEGMNIQETSMGVIP